MFFGCLNELKKVMEGIMFNFFYLDCNGSLGYCPILWHLIASPGRRPVLW